MSIFGQCHLKWVGQSDSITKGAVIGGAGTCSVSLLMVLINRDCGRRWGTAKATGRRYCYGGIWRADERGAGETGSGGADVGRTPIHQQERCVCRAWQCSAV
jgi:hypothetical protein